MNFKTHLILAVILMLGTINTKAASGPDTGRLSKDDAIYAFIAAQMGGQTIHSLEKVLDDSFQYSILRLGHQVSLDKRYTVNFFKKAEITVPDCKIKVLVVSQTVNLTVVKVNMQYRSFSRSDYLTLAKTGGGWKIIFVYELYEVPERKLP